MLSAPRRLCVIGGLGDEVQYLDATLLCSHQGIDDAQAVSVVSRNFVVVGLTAPLASSSHSNDADGT